MGAWALPGDVVLCLKIGTGAGENTSVLVSFAAVKQNSNVVLRLNLKALLERRNFIYSIHIQNVGDNKNILRSKQNLNICQILSVYFAKQGTRYRASTCYLIINVYLVRQQDKIVLSIM